MVDSALRDNAASFRVAPIPDVVSGDPGPWWRIAGRGASQFRDTVGRRPLVRVLPALEDMAIGVRRATAACLRTVPTRWAPLALVLGLQAWSSLVLARTNTVFLDEATYLNAGHQILHSWVHGGSNLYYPTYFSGAPVIYPVISAPFDSLGGLEAARALSLTMMLVSTVLLYATGRRLYGTAAGWCAAAVFGTLGATEFLGALATFDAMALMLMALAAWVVVRAATTTRAVPHAAVFFAAPAMALANATKYASSLFDLVTLGLAFTLFAARFGWRQGVKVTIGLLAVTGSILSTMLAFGGSPYLRGITSTTLLRPSGSETRLHVLRVATSWLGPLAIPVVIAILGIAVGLCMRRLRWAAAGSALVLAVAVFLAPAEQIRIQTTTSLNKHIDFGAWYGALLVGGMLAWIASPRPAPGVHVRRPTTARRALVRTLRGAGVLICLIPMAAAGMHSARSGFKTWVNESHVVSVLKPVVMATTGPVLVDDAEVPAYDLRRSVPLSRWQDTYYLRYTPPHTKRALVGKAAFVAAIRNRRFSVVALDWSSEKAIDDAIAGAIHGSGSYQYVTKVPVSDAHGHSAFVIWRLRG